MLSLIPVWKLVVDYLLLDFPTFFLLDFTGNIQYRSKFGTGIS